ncbi:MAG: FkbM family methyltransferase [Patescibacteria group bacterium]
MIRTELIIPNSFINGGWRGINIEPNEAGYKKFLERRPEDINLNCAVGIGEADYFYAGEGSGNTLMKNVADKRGIAQKRKIQLKPLSEIFSENNLTKVDFISMDVEGFEHEVIKSNDWNKYKATVLCLEGFGYPELKKFGYKLAFWDGGNSYYKLR